jgi:hypothetical protein
MYRRPGNVKISPVCARRCQSQQKGVDSLNHFSSFVSAGLLETWLTIFDDVKIDSPSPCYQLSDDIVFSSLSAAMTREFPGGQDGKITQISN